MPQHDETNQELPPDHAGVAFHPPVMLLVFILLGFGIRAVAPFSIIPDLVAQIVGPIIVSLAFAFFFWALATMRRSGGSVPTGEPTDVIVTQGPYRYSRNPIYLSMIALLLGLGIWVNSLWFVAFAVLSVFLLQWGVISREEAYLERKFGSRYTSYKSHVRRWL